MTDPKLSRRPYHHGNLREALIAAALELAREGGSEAIVVREASRRVGVSHNAAYRHFPDRESLLEAVAARAMGQLAALMRSLVDQVDPADPGVAAARARLRATGRAYIQFAITEPGLFRAAFVSGGGPAGDPAQHAAQGGPPGPFQLLIEALDGLERAGGIALGRRLYAEHAAWSAVHGFSMLALEGPLGLMAPDECDAAMARLFEVIEDGLAGAS